ncbi:MAG: ribonuclease HI [Flavobacteriales bacterium]|nr:ribonuclease HI [Flavobacteriales bacterium]
MSKIAIYTDGAATGNPGPGGYGAILQSGAHYKEMSGGFRLTTNNRMELMGVIAALESLKKENCEVTVYSDSQYVVNSVEKKWLDSWVKKGFRKKKNADLWKRYLLAAANHKVHFVWIKGHAGHPMNERCDALAVNASLVKNLPMDHWYEANRNNEDLFSAA